MFIKKTILGMFFVFFWSLLVSAEAVEIIIEPQKIHVPMGFDSNDNVEIVVAGALPNTCYGQPFGMAKINGMDVILDMKAKKTVGKDMTCVRALAPYLLSIPLGRLEQGTYRVLINTGSDLQKGGELLVQRPSSNRIDDFTYANVTKVKKAIRKGAIILEGIHSSGCIEIDRVEMVPNKINDSYDTVSVLPIVRQVQPNCDRTIKPFSYEFLVPNPQKNDVVFHVRSTEGQALNVRW
jgi:hypothetical protein